MQSGGVSPIPGCAMQVELVNGCSDLLTAEVGKAGLPGSVFVSIAPSSKEPSEGVCDPAKASSPPCDTWVAMPSQLSEIQICVKSDFGREGMGGWEANTFSHFGSQSSLLPHCFWAMTAMWMEIWVRYPNVDLIYWLMTLSAGSFSANLWCRIFRMFKRLSTKCCLVKESL